MLWLKSLLWIVLVTCAVSGSSQEQHLIYAVETEKTIEFYKTDLNLERHHKLLEISHEGNPLENLFVIQNKDKNFVLYYSLQNAIKVGYCVISSGLKVEKRFGNAAWKGVFLGPNSDGNLYFYFHDNKEIRLYDFKSTTDNRILNTMTIRPHRNYKDFEMCCIVRHPYKEQIFFEVVGQHYSRGIDFDMKQMKQLSRYDHSQICYEKCSVAPDEKRIYELGTDAIIVTSRKTLLSENYHFLFHDVTSFAAGNNELFYATEREGQIVKLQNNENGILINWTTHDIQAQGKIMALLVY